LTATTAREAGEKDAALLAGIIQRSFQDVAQRFGLTPENCPKHPSNCTPEWIRDDLKRGVKYAIAEQDHIPVGCFALEAPSHELRYLERLAVLPERRRQGLGRALVGHAFSQAKVSGARRISIAILSEHTELKEWYARLGFTERETKSFPHLPFRVTFKELNIDDTTSKALEATLDSAPQD